MTAKKTLPRKVAVSAIKSLSAQFNELASVNLNASHANAQMFVRTNNEQHRVEAIASFSVGQTYAQCAALMELVCRGESLPNLKQMEKQDADSST